MQCTFPARHWLPQKDLRCSCAREGLITRGPAIAHHIDGPARCIESSTQQTQPKVRAHREALRQPLSLPDGNGQRAVHAFDDVLILRQSEAQAQSKGWMLKHARIKSQLVTPVAHLTDI